jgi:hypothetical protein
VELDEIPEPFGNVFVREGPNGCCQVATAATAVDTLMTTDVGTASGP